MRSLLRSAVAAATLLVLGVAVAPGAAYAVDGDDRVARMRLRVVDAVNEETRHEVERARSCGGGVASGEVGRLERKLARGCRLAAELRAIGARGNSARGRATGGAGSSMGVAGEREPQAGNGLFHAAGQAIPHAPVGVLALVGGVALAIAGWGAAAVVLRPPPRGGG
ncbi:hypothetical protein [Streptomyces sp. NPDC056682]|uniref:hypothetical protein n=1 Tax=Streptomyces sp. NPDC056682 TaxID=3345909 RepID=UPI00368AEC22